MSKLALAQWKRQVRYRAIARKARWRRLPCGHWWIGAEGSVVRYHGVWIAQLATAYGSLHCVESRQFPTLQQAKAWCERNSPPLRLMQ
jgi:hypothetical protein